MLRRVPTRLALIGVLAAGLTACDSGIEPSSIGQEGAPATQPAPAEPAPTTYRLAADGKALIDGAGTRIAIDPKAVTGYVDHAVAGDDNLDLSGWAAPADLARPADVVVAVAGRKSVAVVRPSGDRPDLVDGYGRPGLAQAGYALALPKSALECSKPDQGVKTFAVAGDQAGPLEWLASVPKQIAAAC